MSDFICEIWGYQIDKLGALYDPCRTLELKPFIYDGGTDGWDVLVEIENTQSGSVLSQSRCLTGGSTQHSMHGAKSPLRSASLSLGASKGQLDKQGYARTHAARRRLSNKPREID